MMTLTSEAEKMDETEKNVATLAAKETKDQLVPEQMADLVFIDDMSLLNEVATKLKPAGFLLLHSSESMAAETAGWAIVSKKILLDKTVTLFRKVKYCSKNVKACNAIFMNYCVFCRSYQPREKK